MTNQSSKTTTEQESVSPNKNHENKAKSLAKKFAKRYFIDALGAMVYGLFASLLIGTILKTIFQYIHVEAFQAYFQQIIFWTGAASPLVGAAIGVSVAYGLKSKPLAMYSAVVVGGLAYTMNAVVVTTGSFSAITFSGKGSAGPVGAIIAVIIAVEIGSWLTDKTPFNILVVPAASILSGTLVAILVGPPVGHFMTWLGVVLEKATQLYPFPMKALAHELARFKKAEIVWCQEEPKNMGSWTFVEPYLEWVLGQTGAKAKRPRYAGRPAAAATATGLMSKHLAQLKAFLDEAFAG